MHSRIMILGQSSRRIQIAIYLKFLGVANYFRTERRSSFHLVHTCIYLLYALTSGFLLNEAVNPA